MGSNNWGKDSLKDKRIKQVSLDGMSVTDLIEFFTNVKKEYGESVYLDIETEYGYYEDVWHNYWLTRY